VKSSACALADTERAPIKTAAAGRQAIRSILAAPLLGRLNADADFDACPAIGDILLEWGVNWNKTTYLKAKNVRFESPHVSIVGAGKRH
jgi:hypothetical protein